MLVKDQEAYRWRKDHGREVRRQVQPFLDKAYRRSQSSKTAESKYCGIVVFCGWRRKLPGEILGDIRSGKASPYRLLDEYVGYLVKVEVAPHTTKNYLSAVKKWLRFEEVEINNDKVRDMVELPRQYAITSDRIPTPEELRDLVMVSKNRGKALVTILASSGMRIGETLSLRVKDIDFAQIPTRIHLRAEATKDRQERWCFVSDEAAALLRDYLGSRISQKDSYVFLGRHQGLDGNGTPFKQGGREVKNKPISYWDADVIFTTALRNAGLVEKDDHGRDTIHIHCLRKFFFTRMLAVLGREITEALVGHKEYLDSAYRRYTLDELGSHYLKGMEAVSVLSPKTVSHEEMGRQIELGNYKFYISNSRLAEPVERVLSQAIASKGRRLTMEEELTLFKEEYLTLKQQEDALLDEGTERMMSGIKSEQMLVDETELESLLKSDWTFVSQLSSGKIVVRR